MTIGLEVGEVVEAGRGGADDDPLPMDLIVARLEEAEVRNAVC